MIDFNKKNIYENELHSEKVRNFLDEKPPTIIRYGIAITVAIFLALMIIICFIHCPYSSGETIIQHIFIK